MNKIDELIERLCPEGVKMVKLGEFTEITSGDFVRKDKQNENAPYPVYNGGTTNTGYYDKYNRTGNKVIISARGSAGFVNKIATNFWAGNSVYTIDVKDNANWLYVFFYLKNIQNQIIAAQQRGGGVPAISKKQVEEILIPLPPIEVQREIVSILDKFTEYSAQLKAELKAELKARKEQYQYYIDYFFGFNVDDIKSKENTKTKVCAISEIGSLVRGKRFVRDDVRESGTPCIHYGDMYTYYGISAKTAKTFLDRDFPKIMRYAEKDDVIIVGAGENDWDIGVGMVWEGAEPAAVHDACYILKHDCNPKYIAYYLRSTGYHQQLKKRVTSGKICSVSADGIGKCIIPIPPREEQDKIVSFIDSFEHLTADLQNGLPAEIEAVEERYEYYRNKLLTFKTEE